MKRSFRNNIRLNFRWSLIILLSLIAPVGSTIAAELKEATVTQIIKNVQLLPAQAAPRPAVVKDHVRENTAVRTGADSRTELTFTNQTLTRLGANTIFSFNQGTRNLNLSGGVMLLYVPKGSGGATISSAAVSVAITGTTVLMEYHRNAYIKFISLEGIARVYLRHHLGESVLIHPGQMLIVRPDATSLPDPANVDLKRILKTSLLITDFPPLPSEALMYQEAQNQSDAKAKGQFVDTNLVIYGGGTVVSLVDPTNVNVISQGTAAIATPTPIPSKFGPPSAITSPNPYVINSGTVVNTDPTITTNGITNFGKIYRGLAQDGPLFTWLGSSPSPFDTAFGQSGEPSPDRLPAAGFLFSALRLDGDPTVSNPNGVATLGLVSQNGITSSPSGTVFTFSGMNEVALIALGGSIDLSGISFANFGDLSVFARGSGGNITLAAPISNLDRVQLHALNNIQVNAPVTVKGTVQDHRGFKATAGNDVQIGSTVNANQITIQSLGSIHIDSSAQLLALLDAAGNGGQIVILATGGSSSLNVKGKVQADQGLVDIRNTGDSGTVNLTNADVRADIVKVAALGTNGTLNIGGGTISADTTLQLYSTGSNGTINFIANVTLGGTSSKIIAANTVTIFNNVVVTIGGAKPASAFTNNANYSDTSGGNGTTTGTFAGAGATTQPLANAPPLGTPPP